MQNRKKTISIVIPTKNEEITIAKFIDSCKAGIQASGLEGEIIFLDSSSDKTPNICKSLGAKIIQVDTPGLGNAYANAQNRIDGDYVFLGDADCTYDFTNLIPFINKLDSGYDFVIGNRFKGVIEKKAMPMHHQYFGSPATSLFFRYALGIPTGDIHCGMRAMTRELFNELPFLEKGWEYATEMIVSARNLDARIIEIPINFYKEPEGRVSHHKRDSWLSPFRAGWGTLRVTTTYLLERLFVVPGLVGMSLFSIGNLLIFIFPNFFFNRFNIGILSQSFLTFLTSICGFMFTSGMLARLAYRRQSNYLRGILIGNFSHKAFTVLMFFTICQFAFTAVSISQWFHGLNSAGPDFEYNFRYLSWWLAFSSLFFTVLSISVVSLVGTHAQKFKKS
jgi:glycosyltransferase involved in cell wall biosynthesis